METSSAPTQNETPQSQTIGSATFLSRIPEAHAQVAYSGVRHVLVNYTIAGKPSVLEYDEEVWSDGQGKFAIHPGRVFSPPMTVAQAQFFAILQEQRDGFFYRHRDFRIRDLPLFLQNWSASDSGQREDVAGRSGSVLDFHRIGGARSWYRAWIDPETGLVLRAEERDAGGELVSRVEFRSFTLTPDLTGAALHGDRFATRPLDVQSDTTSTIGFQVRAPTLLPKGYRLEKSESLNDGENTWARIGYSDGVEQVFFLQTSVPPPGASSSSGPSESDTRAPRDEVDVGPRSVRIFQVGPWTVLQGRFEERLVIVMGKVDQMSLERMLKSAVL